MRVGVDAKAALRRVRTGGTFVRLEIWIRLLWLLIVLFGFTVLAFALPELWRTVTTPCAGSTCEPGQPTVAGLEQLSRIGLPPAFYSSLAFGLGGLIPLTITLVMGVLLWRKPTNRTVVALAYGGVACSFIGVFGLAAERWAWLGIFQSLLEVIGGVGLGFGLLAFPDGRFVPRWGRWLAFPLVLASLTALFPVAWGGAVATGAFMLTFPLAFALLLLRYRRSDHVVRVQIKWVLYGVSLMVLALVDSLLLETLLPAPLNETGAPGDLVTTLLGGGSIVFFWLCLALSVYRYNLFAIDLVIRRTLLYGSLSLGVLLLYGALVTVAGLLSWQGNDQFVALLVTALVALVFNPLRVRLQRSINRLLYGQRSNPYALVSSLTERLAGLLEPAQVFPVTVETVATALKLPFAAIALGPESRTVASHGTPQAHVEHLPLRYAGEEIGRLSVSPRGGEDGLAPADRRLLTDLARQVSASAHAYLLSADLERSRLSLVSAREEARRDLGNDLHDSVGHGLAGLTRRAEAVANLLTTDPERARVLLGEVIAESRATATQVRALAHRLHPPELELLGLVGSVRELVEGGDEALHISLEAASLPRLPAAVEVSAYYTVQEALYNVRRHAHARHVWVRLELCEAVKPAHSALTSLRLEVLDDGCGVSVDARQGLGLRSMAGRAAELGGCCTVEVRKGGGTRLVWQVPCPDH